MKGLKFDVMNKTISKYADATILFLLLSVLIGSTLGGVLAIAFFTNLNLL